ncbi:MAG: TetR/AcrR family transcriptional regulator [Desulfobacteraceae bacterium]|nr:TetR/AcrR family transcriptional regulator [Desulfobacteraceae bacterium]
MSKRSETFLKSWESNIEKLVKVSAKKNHAVETKHRQIVEGACSIFFKKGFHPTSMREIAEAAGMSMGQMYHYISSKDDVLFLIHKHVQVLWYQVLTDAKIEEIGDPSRKLELALRRSLSFLLEHKDHIQFIYSESKYLSREHLKVVLEMDNKNVVEYWRELIANALEQQGVKADIDMAANLIAYNNVFLALRNWNLKHRPIEERIEFVVNFLFQGLGLSRPS